MAIGYELRSAKPIPFDAEYTRTLGYGAVRYLLGGGSGSLIALAGGRIHPVTLEEMLDPATGRIRVPMRLARAGLPGALHAYGRPAVTLSSSMGGPRSCLILRRGCGCRDRVYL